VFVRHALPGERVVVEVTEDRGGNFCRADAVEVLGASEHRVQAPCPYAAPGACGGCDFQHVALEEQRRLKSAVIAEQFVRLAKLDLTPVVEGLDDTGLGWRRRVRYAVAGDGTLGLHAHRSESVILVDRCLIGAPGVGDSEVLNRQWPGANEIEVAVDDHGDESVMAYRRRPERPSARPSGRPGAHGRSTKPQLESHQVSGPEYLSYEVHGQHYEVSAGGFWQTHPAAASTFVDVVLEQVAQGDRVLDLYSGSGLFTVAIAAAVGDAGRVHAIEGDRRAVEDAERNLEGFPNATVEAATVTSATIAAAVDHLGRPDVVVLDPPRTGAGREIMTALMALEPRAIVYVACDPAALARDVGTARESGWHLAGLRAFDAFPMTHHVESVATLRPA
jgi:tRNA/tmRNA/rRNA uracil-C5-methylase (TrmA/RlmC/RlmD family)